MVDASDCVWGADFFQTYLKHASKTSYFNQHLHKAASLSLIGQSLRDVFLVSDNTKIDCRIHPFVIQDSGSGKNGAFNFMAAVAREAGMNFFKEGTTSTAGIMGTVDQDGTVDPGNLAGNGFLAWKEAQTLVKSANKQHSDDILEVINMALDPSGQVSKSLSGGKLEYSSRTSMFSTTYPPEPEGQIDLIHQGFLPRMLFMYKKIPPSQYDRINNKRDKGLPTDDKMGPQDRNTYSDDIEKLANTLKYIREQVSKHGKILSKGEDPFAITEKDIHYFTVAEDASMNTAYIFDEMKDQYSYRVQQEVKPFKTRLFDLTYKIAAAFAAVDKDEENGVYVSRKIRKKHTDLAHDVLRECWRSIFDFCKDYMGYEMGGDLRKLEHRVVQTCKNDPNNCTTIKDIMKMSYMDKDDVTNRLMTLEEMDKVRSNGTPFAAAEPDSKVLLGPDNQEDGN